MVGVLVIDIHFLYALVLPLQMLSFGFLPDGYVREIQKIWEMFHLVLG